MKVQIKCIDRIDCSRFRKGLKGLQRFTEKAFTDLGKNPLRAIQVIICLYGCLLLFMAVDLVSIPNAALGFVLLAIPLCILTKES